MFSINQICNINQINFGYRIEQLEAVQKIIGNIFCLFYSMRFFVQYDMSLFDKNNRKYMIIKNIILSYNFKLFRIQLNVEIINLWDLCLI